MKQIAYPYALDHRGCTAASDEDRHIRDLVEQVLFTSPGERINRPNFGTPILQLVFEPNSDALPRPSRRLSRLHSSNWESVSK